MLFDTNIEMLAGSVATLFYNFDTASVERMHTRVKNISENARVVDVSSVEMFDVARSVSSGVEQMSNASRTSETANQLSDQNHSVAVVSEEQAVTTQEISGNITQATRGIAQIEMKGLLIIPQ